MYMGWLFMPVLGIVFCIYLVSIMKKIKNDLPTERDTLVLSITFGLIVWTIAILASIG